MSPKEDPTPIPAAQPGAPHGEAPEAPASEAVVPAHALPADALPADAPDDERSGRDHGDLAVAMSPRQIIGGFALLAGLILMLRRHRRKG